MQNLNFLLARFIVVISVLTSANALANLDTSAPANNLAVPAATEFLSEHQASISGKSINYTVTAGEIYLVDEAGDPKASIFSFSYKQKGEKASTTRPVTFIWNGGPGSPSVWLHMGAIGPKRVDLDSNATHAGTPPYPVVNELDSLLAVSDLVFIDPVGTGYSKALGQHQNKDFWGLSEDANSMAEFIQTWITKHNRWNSPRFILGESFGTTRAAAVALTLEQKHNISLNGLVLVSQALDYQGSSPYFRDNIISYVTYIPTMAATAWYHSKITPKPINFDDFIDEARQFAVDELLPALFKGNTIDDATRVYIRDKLAYFTGLSPEYIERVNLRINGYRFSKELLRDQGLVLGRNDGRYISDEIDDVAADPRRDPSSDAISSAYHATFMQYLQNDLQINWQRQYRFKAHPELTPNWRWRPVPDGQAWEPTYVNTTHDLSQVLRINPSLDVFVAAGYYDLITPFFDAEYTLNRHDIEASRVNYSYYTGGHMMYLNEQARVKFLADVSQFIKNKSTTE